MDAAGILASRVLHEKQPVTYRVLSRQLSIHVNQAKQELYAFAQENAGKVKATYLISGFMKVQKADDSQKEEEIAEDVDMKTVATVDTASVPRQVFELVQQDDLEERKSTFEIITSVHVYSLQPGPLKPAALSLLVTINNAIHSDPKLVKAWSSSKNGAAYGVIQQQGRKSFPKPTPAAPAKPEASTSKTTSSSKASSSSTSTSSKRKAEEEKDEKPKKASGSKLKPAPAPEPKKKASASSSAVSSSSNKKAAEEKSAPASKKQDRKPDASMDVDDFDDDLIDSQQKELEAMMDEYDADESKAAEPTKDAGKGKDKEPEPVESKPPKEKKRVKKTRKVMKVTKDEKGYKKREEVEEEYSGTESDSDAEPKKKAKNSSADASTKKSSANGGSSKASSSKDKDKKAEEKPKKKAPAGKPGAQTSMKSFFTKKA